MLPLNRHAPVGPSSAWRLLALLVLLVAGCNRQTPTPPPLVLPPEQYQKLVSAFFTGVTAYQVGDGERARTRFREATELAAEEPAAWANHALAEARAGDSAAAAEAIRKARTLAPDSSAIALVAAQIESRQGETDASVDLLREAVALDGDNLRARYALVEELDRQAGADSDAAGAAEIRAQLEAILGRQPANLMALFDLGRLAAKTGDAALLDQVIARLAPLADSWDADTRARLAELEGAAKAADTKSLATKIVVLRNLLLTTAAYQQSVESLKAPPEAIGLPLERLIRVPNPSARPSEPDLAIRFEPPAEDPKFEIEGRLAGDHQPIESTVMFDWNNDQAMDAAIANRDGLKLYLIPPGGEPVEGIDLDVTDRTGLDASVTKAAYTGGWAVDIDLEGDLDLILGTAEGPPVVLRNNADGTWTKVDSPFAEADGVSRLFWADLDGDADPDVATLGPDGVVRVYANERTGRYRLVPDDLAPAVVQNATAAAGVSIAPAWAISVADPDWDGQLDLVVGSGSSIQRRTWLPEDQWEVETITDWPDAPVDGLGRLLWGDLDNNGGQDLVASGAGRSRVWLADTDASLLPLPDDAIPQREVESLDDGNFDHRLDLGTIAGISAIPLYNTGGEKDYHWQVIRPRGLASIEGDQRINSFGIGGDVALRAGLLTQIQPITNEAHGIHFGLGDNPAADVARIRWPSGIAQGEFDLAADTEVVAEQRLKGSCPWLFADNGEAMAFVTDILWKSPLGLRINAQSTAGVVQTRDWVKVRGDQLAERDGAYDLRITAELWETHFFDHVALMTVDHPTGTEVFVDERFAIPPPPLTVQATTPVRPVAAAVDQSGGDVSDTVAALDGRHLDTFDLGKYQGIAQDHFVELELPDGITDDSVLVAQGFIYPTDSSINVAIGQGKQDTPRDLNLEIPDGLGGWRVAREHLGFPAGKHKTMLIDLAGLFPADHSGPRRLRLRTNMEIYWDRLAVAERLPGAEITTATLRADTADLRYRGFSTTNYTDGTGKRTEPELPDYDRVAATTQIWPDLVGFYTRFGDVKPLLADVDDRYVILNAGDEIALKFPAPAPPPTGWTRDFVFVSDGWEKDGDFNTSYSKTVQPLPSHDRPEYAEPWDAGPVGALADDPVVQAHAQDWVDYHTRYVTPEVFRRGIWPAED